MNIKKIVKPAQSDIQLRSYGAPTICPTITAANSHHYQIQMERVATFASRVHIDLSDGMLSPSKLLPLDKIWWPGGIRADLHVMLRSPFSHVALYRALSPQMVIVHAEAEGDFIEFAHLMHQHGIETGVALLQDTPVDTIAPALDLIDHVLIFSGKLGFFGGTADLALLDKVRQLRALKPTLEIGWDGGVNDKNARRLAMGGIDVLNVGGYIHHADQPQQAYAKLFGKMPAPLKPPAPVAQTEVPPYL